jgi:hypothetical protein
VVTACELVAGLMMMGILQAYWELLGGSRLPRRILAWLAYFTVCIVEAAMQL